MESTLLCQNSKGIAGYILSGCNVLQNTGKDVLCDKPAASDLEDALAMNQAAKENDRIYGMVFHQRLYPKYKKIKEMLECGEIGELKRVCQISTGA